MNASAEEVLRNRRAQAQQSDDKLRAEQREREAAQRKSEAEVRRQRIQALEEAAKQAIERLKAKNWPDKDGGLVYIKVKRRRQTLFSTRRTLREVAGWNVGDMTWLTSDGSFWSNQMQVGGYTCLTTRGFETKTDTQLNSLLWHVKELCKN
jgi:hypothetical protein